MTRVFLTMVSVALLATTAVASDIDIRSINGVATYPENYNGTPHRHPEEDPFLSPSNSALILIDYQPHIMMGVRNIEHADLINNTKALIKSAVHFDVPVVFRTLASATTAHNRFSKSCVNSHQTRSLSIGPTSMPGKNLSLLPPSNRSVVAS